MSNVLIASMVGVGVAAWVYSKFARSTGGNTRNSVGGAAVAGTMAFLVMMSILWLAS